MSSKGDKTQGKQDKAGENTNGIRMRKVKPYVTGPTSKISSRSLNRIANYGSWHKTSTTSSKSSTNHLLCKEIFANKDATVEVTVKTKSSGVRKQHGNDSPTPLVSKDHKNTLNDDSGKQLPSVSDHKGSKNICMNKSKKISKSKHLSWAHLLSEDSGCIIHSEKSQAGKGLYVSKKKTSRICSNVHEHLADDSAISSISTENSSTSDKDSVHYIDRSVQCHLPRSAVSSVPDEHKLLPPNFSSKCACGDESSNFSIFNPLRTLNFLIKELRGILQKCGQDGNLQRIISDMENAVLRIPSEMKEESFEIPTRDGSASAKPYKFSQVGFVPLQPTQTSLPKPILVPKAKLTGPQSLKPTNNVSTLVHENPEQRTDDADPYSMKSANPTIPPTWKKTCEAQPFPDSGMKHSALELACKQLELTCQQQKRENEALIEQIASQKKELEVMTSKEKDYLTTISCLKSNIEIMSKKAEEQARFIEDLTTKYNHLKEECETLRKLTESQAVHKKQVKENTDEEKKMFTRLQIMKLERQKFEMLLASKERELEKFKLEFRNIETFATEQLQKLKSYEFSPRTMNETDETFRDIGKQSLLNSDSDLDSLATEVTLFFQKSQRGEDGDTGKHPVCSSPTSSANSSLGICQSWRKISNITPASSKILNKQLSASELITPSTMKRSSMKESEDDIDKGEDMKKFNSFSKENSLEFKSFLLDSVPHILPESSCQSSLHEPKSCQELKDKLSGIFERIKNQARMNVGIPLLRPPQHYSSGEPGGMSQWTEGSDAGSVLNSSYFSATITGLNNAKYDLSNSG